MTNWKLHKIKDIIKQSRNIEVVEQDKYYSILGMSLEGRGLFVRETKRASELGSKTLNKVIPGEFIYSRLFAWKGAFDCVIEKFENSFVSNEYPCFIVDENKADVKFITYYFNQRKVWKEVENYCAGVTKASRNRFKESSFLNLSIYLPSLEEQKRIVAKVENVKQKTERINQIREVQNKEIQNLLYSKYFDIIKGAKWLPMKKIAPIIRRELVLSENELYPELGIRSFGKGTFHKPAITGLEVGTKKIYQIKEGDLLFSNVFAWEGAIAIAKKEDNDRYGSHRFISCVTNDDVLTEFLCYHFLSEKGLEDINLCSPGGAGRNRTLGLQKLMNITVPVPNIELQKEFVSLLNKVEIIKQNIVDTDSELTELIPSILDKAFKGELFTTIQQKEEAIQASSIPESKLKFAKQVLGGKIVSLFKDDKNFTSIKFQKLQYLAEHIIEEDLCWNYYRQSAGPYDNKFMHSVVSNFERNKWFKQRDYKYYPLEKALEIEQYYQNYFGQKSDKLSHLFRLLINASERFCEAIATIYAVWNNHLLSQVSFDKEKIKADFFEWSTRKEDIFSEDDFEKAISWMQKYGIVPTGFGHLIKERK